MDDKPDDKQHQGYKWAAVINAAVAVGLLGLNVFLHFRLGESLGPLSILRSGLAPFVCGGVAIWCWWKYKQGRA